MEAPGATPLDEGSVNWPPNWRVEEVATTGSTNADLLELAASGAPDRTVLRADHQTAGRGRLDRTWEAPPRSNLLVSLLLRHVPTPPVELSWRVALAACAASERVAGVAPTLKWPNDLLLDGRKLAGVLAQAGGAGASRHVVVGVGLNVGWAPEGAASLGAGIDPRRVLAELLRAYDELPGLVMPLYRSRLATLGSAVRVELPGGSSVEGRAVDLAADGRLVVLDGCGITHRFDSGDVIHLR